MTGYPVLGIEFYFEESWTVVAVTCGPPEDGTLGVQGRHVKRFSTTRSALDILQREIARGDHLLWPLEARAE